VVAVSVLADFAGALAARAGVLLVEPLADLAAGRLTPAGDLAAVRFTGSSVAGRALVAAT